MKKGFIADKKFREILKLAPICTVDVLIFNKDMSRTLLFRRNNEPLKGKYFSLGGRLVKNEKLENCASRKLFEEAGIKAKKGSLFFGGVADEVNNSSIFKGVNYHAVNIFYGYIADENIKIKLDDQHDDYKWFPVDDKKFHKFLRHKIDITLNRYGKEF